MNGAISVSPREPGIQACFRVRRQVQSQLASPPEDIVSGARPLGRAQVVDLASVHTGENFVSQVVRVANQTLDARAVSACIASAKRCGQPRIAALDRAQESSESGWLRAAA